MKILKSLGNKCKKTLEIWKNQKLANCSKKWSDLLWQTAKNFGYLCVNNLRINYSIKVDISFVAADSRNGSFIETKPKNLDIKSSGQFFDLVFLTFGELSQNLIFTSNFSQEENGLVCRFYIARFEFRWKNLDQVNRYNFHGNKLVVATLLLSLNSDVCQATRKMSEWKFSYPVVGCWQHTNLGATCEPADSAVS